MDRERIPDQSPFHEEEAAFSMMIESGSATAASCLKRSISNAIKMTQGIRDKNENTMPTVPAEEGMIINSPDVKAQIPNDFFALGLFSNAAAYSSKPNVLKT